MRIAIKKISSDNNNNNNNNQKRVWQAADV